MMRACQACRFLNTLASRAFCTNPFSSNSIAVFNGKSTVLLLCFWYYGAGLIAKRVGGSVGGNEADANISKFTGGQGKTWPTKQICIQSNSRIFFETVAKC